MRIIDVNETTSEHRAQVAHARGRFGDGETMKGRSLQLAAVGLSVFALLCWLVIFVAGTDVWHDVGSPTSS